MGAQIWMVALVLGLAGGALGQTANGTTAESANMTNFNGVLVGAERCRYIGKSIIGGEYGIFKALTELLIKDQGLKMDDKDLSANLLELCGQPFINPNALVRKYAIELKGGNLTAPIYYGIMDQVSQKGNYLLSMAKSGKLVKVLQMLNLQAGYIPPALQLKTVFNETSKKNETEIIESSLIVQDTEEWKNFTKETLNLTTAEFLDFTVNIIILGNSSDIKPINATGADYHTYKPDNTTEQLPAKRRLIEINGSFPNSIIQVLVPLGNGQFQMASVPAGNIQFPAQARPQIQILGAGPTPTFVLNGAPSPQIVFDDTPFPSLSQNVYSYGIGPYSQTNLSDGQTQIFLKPSVADGFGNNDMFVGSPY